MPYERSITARVPRPATGRRWQAAALLEAPDIAGHPGDWKAIEAVPVDGVVPDTISTRHAEYATGWYRIQWYDDGQNSVFSTPVQISDQQSTGRRWGT